MCINQELIDGPQEEADKNFEQKDLTRLDHTYHHKSRAFCKDISMSLLERKNKSLQMKKQPSETKKVSMVNLKPRKNTIII